MQPRRGSRLNSSRPARRRYAVASRSQRYHCMTTLQCRLSGHVHSKRPTARPELPGYCSAGCRESFRQTRSDGKLRSHVLRYHLGGRRHHRGAYFGHRSKDAKHGELTHVPLDPILQHYYASSFLSCSSAGSTAVHVHGYACTCHAACAARLHTCLHTLLPCPRSTLQ